MEVRMFGGGDVEDGDGHELVLFIMQKKKLLEVRR